MKTIKALLFAFAAGCVSYQAAIAQCPVAPSCTPGAISSNTTYGVFNVILNTLNNSTSGGATYTDYSCTQQTTLAVDSPYTISVTTGTAQNENVKVWIDYNNDGVLNFSTELVFFSNNKLTNHSGKIKLPATADVDSILRMRVYGDVYWWTIYSSCDNAYYGEYEDYAIKVAANTSAPGSNFGAASTLSCDGTVNFIDSSFNLPASWKWDFGDGNTDTAQNPTHTYASGGFYTVALIAGNAYGSDTFTRTNYIQVDIKPLPSPASCTPGTSSYSSSYKMGIYNVIFNTINDTTPDGIDGYKDYTCSQRTSITAGVPTSFTVKTGTTYNENVRAWIDYDTNGVFNTATELVFSSDNKLTTHSGKISIPGSAALNTPMRLRIAADAYFSAAPAPCTNVSYGQFEDYTVIALPNNNPPVANFSSSKTVTCDGAVTFYDSTINLPTSWLWNFGDGNTDTVQNPTHTYATNDTFTVILVVNNAFGSDTFTRTNFIRVNLGGEPIAASCTPSTTNYCCGMGISNVTFGTINNTTADGAEGYKDYSCAYQASITQGIPAAVTVKTGTGYNENLRIWIDYNNDGAFDSTEVALASDNKLTNHSGSIIAPGDAVLNTPLRMRVASDYYAQGVPSPCTNVYYGQVEDYSVVILPNTNPPAANFGANKTFTCDGTIIFYDSTLNVATSWKWNFGDGNTDTVQSPAHTYTSTDTFTVTLIATNAYGSDTFTRTNFIKVTIQPVPVVASCTPTTLYYDATYKIGIYNVTLGSINNTTPDAIEKYRDYTCPSQASIMVGVPTAISIRTGATYNESVRVWIDYNNNGVFNDTTELAFSSDNKLTNHTGSISIPGTAATNVPLRMRVSSEITWYTAPTSCSNLYYGQAEDYTIIALPNTNPPSADFSANPVISCNGRVDFTDLSANLPGSWKWLFGDGQTSTLQNPSHTYTSSDTFTVTLIATNAFGTDTVKKTNYVRITSLNGPKDAACMPQTIFPSAQYGLFAVRLDSINKISLLGDGYQDYTCSQHTTLKSGIYYNIDVTTGFTTNENTRAWIDLNNDGVFADSAELIFSSNDVFAYHSGKIMIPATADTNVALRMRVGSDLYYYAPPSPCNNVNSGQFEDYSVTILPNYDSPVSAFAVNDTLSCNGTVAFSDSSINHPISWKWKFGDGQTSTLQNPVHTYAASGYYTVSLVTTNAYGSDTLKKTNYIHVVIGNTPKTATCTAGAMFPDNDFGVFNVSLSTINNSSSGGNEYVDYNLSCNSQTSLIVATNYPISVTTGASNNENVRVWIDYDNDGRFNDTTEVAFYSYNKQTNHNGTINIPATAVTDTLLRMRVASDFYFYTPVMPCTDLYYGEFEDYGIIALPNTNPPVASFGVDKALTCNGTVNFSDSSSNIVTSWLWNFGDGQTSSLQNPSHTYSAPGTYTVTLIATNSFGKDTLVKNSYVTVTVGTAPVAASCYPSKISTAYDLEVHNFTYANINNSTAINDLAYEDFTCTHQIYVLATKSTPVSIQTGPYYANTRIWIDYNNDGVFDTISERALNFINSGTQGTPYTGNITVPPSAVQQTPLRLRVALDAWGAAFAYPTPCNTLYYGQAEDYTVYVYPSNTKPNADYSFTVTNACKGIVQFSDKSLFSPTSWSWDFGDGIGVSTSKSPTYTFSSPGTYTVRLIVSNTLGSDTMTQILLLNPLKVNFSISSNPVNTGVAVNFTDSSIVADQWLWNFGDFSGDTVPNPTHTYYTAGIYPVKLTATNFSTGCVVTKTKQVIVLDPSGINDIGNDYVLSIFPNPASDNLHIFFVSDGKSDFEVSVISLLGQEFFNEKAEGIEKYERTVSLSQYSKGIYLVKIKTGEKIAVKKIIVQ